jgi:hypothetical protein
MLKKSLPVLSLALLLLAGCATQLTNLTPLQQLRDTNNTYRVEVAFDTRQQTVRWQSIQPKIIVGKESYDMHTTPFMTNRWEGLIPVPPGVNSVRYRYRLDFKYNRMGEAGHDNALSQEYTLRILDQ